MNQFKTYFFAFLAGLGGAAVAIAFSNSEPTNEERIADYYKTQVAVNVSPHGFRKHMEDGKYILVDTRSEEEYLEGHIKGAINIPAYKNKDESAYGDVERIVKAFSALPKDKEIITYCYSIPCMTSRKVGKMLADHGIYVKHLNVGWNEWKYSRTMWNHEHEWDITKPEDYIESGEYKAPKNTGKTDDDACPVNNELGC